MKTIEISELKAEVAIHFVRHGQSATLIWLRRLIKANQGEAKAALIESYNWVQTTKL